MAKLTELPVAPAEPDVDQPQKKATPSIPPPINRVEVDQEVEKIKKNRELPPNPGTNVSFSELQAWLRLLKTPEQQNRISVYVYRHFPPIVRQKVNPDADNNIDVIVDGFNTISEKYFIDNHGGGTYSFIVADSDAYGKRKQNEGGYFKAKLEIPIAEHEPKINYGEVEWDHPKVKGFEAWARSKGKIDSMRNPIEKGSNRPNGNGTGKDGESADPQVQMMKMQMHFMEKMVDKMSDAEKDKLKREMGNDTLSKSFGEIFIEKMKQEDPNKSTTAFTQMLTAMGGMFGKKDDGGNQMAMFTLMMEMQKSNTQMLMEVLKSNQQQATAGDGGSAKSGISEMKEMFELFKELGGGKGGDKKSTTEMLIDKGLEVVTPAIGLISNILMLKASQNQAQQPQGAIPPAGGTQQSYQPNPMQGTPVSALPSGQPTSVPMGQSLSSPGAGSRPLTMYEQMMLANKEAMMQKESQKVNGKMVEMANPISSPTVDTNPGNNMGGTLSHEQLVFHIRQFGPLILENMTKDGYLLPDMVSQFFPQGQQIVDTICNCGEDAVIGAIKAVPELWGQIQARFGEPHLKEWVSDFCDYKNVIAEIEAQEQEDDKDKEGEDK